MDFLRFLAFEKKNWILDQFWCFFTLLVLKSRKFCFNLKDRIHFVFLVNLSITSSKEFSAWPNSTKSTYIVRIVLKIPKSLWEAHMFFFSFCWASNIKPSYAPAMYGKILLSWFMSVLHAGIALYASNQVIQANPFQLGFLNSLWQTEEIEFS